MMERNLVKEVMDVWSVRHLEFVKMRDTVECRMTSKPSFEILAEKFLKMYLVLLQCI